MRPFPQPVRPMRRKAEAIVAAGRALIGVRFRPQGRSAETGLDCIGVVVMATDTDPARVRRDYRLRGADAEAMNGEFEAHGFLRLAPIAAEPGDFLVVQAGPMQVHIVLRTECGYLHADMGLRRVVEVPGPQPWPVLSAWRR
jgi:murein DD-endopeptidase / murein LD-carboxypeptidase